MFIYVFTYVGIDSLISMILKDYCKYWWSIYLGIVLADGKMFLNWEMAKVDGQWASYTLRWRYTLDKYWMKCYFVLIFGFGTVVVLCDYNHRIENKLCMAKLIPGQNEHIGTLWDKQNPTFVINWSTIFEVIFLYLLEFGICTKNYIRYKWVNLGSLEMIIDNKDVEVIYHNLCLCLFWWLSEATGLFAYIPWLIFYASLRQIFLGEVEGAEKYYMI